MYLCLRATNDSKRLSKFTRTKIPYLSLIFFVSLHQQPGNICQNLLQFDKIFIQPNTNDPITTMKLAYLLLLSPLLASAFHVQSSYSKRPGFALQMSSEIDSNVALVVTGNNIDVTTSLQEYVEKRIGGPLKKLGGDGIVRECDVHLSVYKNPKVRKRKR